MRDCDRDVNRMSVKYSRARKREIEALAVCTDESHYTMGSPLRGRCLFRQADFLLFQPTSIKLSPSARGTKSSSLQYPAHSQKRSQNLQALKGKTLVCIMPNQNDVKSYFDHFHFMCFQGCMSRSIYYFDPLSSELLQEENVNQRKNIGLNDYIDRS